MLLDALLGQFLNHFGLCCDRGVVGAWYPTSILALHTGTTNENILNSIVQHMSHMQHTRYVGWWNNDGVGLTSIGF